MPRSPRQSGRYDTIALAACIGIALLLRAADESATERVARALRRSVLRPLLSLQESAERTRHAFLRFESTSASRDSLALRVMAAEGIEAENARLRSLLRLAPRVRESFVVAQALHGQPLGEEYTLMLTAGSEGGVTPQAPVIAADGLVGMVRTVDPHISLAILTSHPKFAASARSADSSVEGLVSPHLGSEPDRNLLEMRSNVGYRTQLPIGSLIVTSGIGKVYPEGIPLGRVISELKTPEEGVSRTYLLEPTVRASDVTSVMILLPPHSASVIKSIWSTRERTDANARGVVAAGDSITRLIDAVIAERVAAARKAVFDSITAVSPGFAPRPLGRPPDSLPRRPPPVGDQP